MTCASPYLPFNTMVRVIDLKTGKSIVVRVNDRMPRRGRDIDLTIAAANNLGIRQRGKVHVRLEPMEVAEIK
jgi:rare lipoprotein A